MASEEDFRQRVFTSAINLLVPDFYQKAIDPEYMPEPQDVPGTGEIFFPASEGEFDAMLAEFEAADAALHSKQVFDSFDSLGDRT